MKQITFEEFRHMIADQFGIPLHSFSVESSFGDDLGADDLDMVELIMDVEDEYSVQLDDWELERQGFMDLDPASRTGLSFKNDFTIQQFIDMVALIQEGKSLAP